ncbi:MAG: NACHT domain-containing protein [Ktedonobacteraceae bacterium]|nr:NACHT domain-containing protein [Ktedonobacteraceae bacterium]
MQALRTTIGLTQVELADQLRVSRYAIGGWETGQSYPKAEHLKHFIALGLQQHAFSVGREGEEIRKLWQTSHQKVFLDESWLYALLSKEDYPLPPVEQGHNHKLVSAPPPKNEQRVDWDQALDIHTFHGRTEELALLSRWIIQEHCRVVSIVGMGGIGKSALATKVMHQVAAQFDVVIWRSLRDAPSCEALVDACLQILAPQTLQHMPHSREVSIRTLMEHLRERRVLLVLDNLEMILEDSTDAGRMHAGTEGYAYLLQRVGETRHQGCLLLTSREKPTALVPLEGRRSLVRTLRLAGLDVEAGVQLLAEKDVAGSQRDQIRLVETYHGNPLALKIIAQTIIELFGGEIDPFFKQGEFIFGGVRELLDEQFKHLSTLEQSTLLWLAILREPVNLKQLVAVLNVPRSPMQILEALGRLHQSGLIERGHRSGTFTLHSVVLEYATARLITEASSEIEQGRLDRCKEYGLCQAQGREYLRRTQERLLMVPLLTRLQSIYQGQATLEARLLWLLDQLRDKDQIFQGYGPTNLVTLLRLLRGDLHNLDLARLALRSLSLQGVELQDTSLSEAILRDATFSEAIDAIMVVAVSSTGQYWAAATRQGYVRIWQESGQTLHRVWQAHISGITALVFSPDGHTLASGGWDNTVRLWNSASGTLLWTGEPTGGINCIAFTPDGHLLTTSGNDTLVRFWDLRSSTSVQTLAEQDGAVYSLAWSPDGRLLVRGCSDGSIRLWRPQETLPGSQEHILTGHTRWVTGLAFAPNGSQLASASVDGTVKLWDMENLECLQTFSGHTDRVLRVAWSPDGRTLASCSFDQTIGLWDVKERRSRAMLYGHSGLHSIAFTPDSQILLSGSNDGTIRVWDVESGQCLRIIGGYYTNSLLDVDWSPDNAKLASGGADSLVTLWKKTSISSPLVLRGHSWIVQGVAWSPDGQLLASSGYDNSIRLWDTDTGLCLRVLKDPDAIDSIFFGVAWSPDGRLLACGSFLPGVQVWDVATNSRRWIRRTGPTLIRRVAWSPDGMQVVGGGDDGYVYMWDARDGIQKRLAGHHGAVMSVAWSPDGIRLASAGGSIKSGEIFIWEAHKEEHVRALAKHPGAISSVTWSPGGKELISGDADGKLCWWEIQSGQCVRVQAAHQGMVQALKVSPDGSKLASCGDDGAILIWDLHSDKHLETLRQDRPYERLNITAIRGVTEAQKASLRALGAVEETSVKR